MSDNERASAQDVLRVDGENLKMERQLAEAFFEGYKYAIKVLTDGIPKEK